jgi:hypothetical protein
MVIDCHAHLEPRMLELDRIMALHVDLSSPYLDEPLARAAVAAMGPERCLYGTDSPYGFHGRRRQLRLRRDPRLGRAAARVRPGARPRVRRQLPGHPRRRGRGDLTGAPEDGS